LCYLAAGREDISSELSLGRTNLHLGDPNQPTSYNNQEDRCGGGNNVSGVYLAYKIITEPLIWAIIGLGCAVRGYFLHEAGDEEMLDRRRWWGFLLTGSGILLGVGSPVIF